MNAASKSFVLNKPSRPQDRAGSVSARQGLGLAMMLAGSVLILSLLVIAFEPSRTEAQLGLAIGAPGMVIGLIGAALLILGGDSLAQDGNAGDQGDMNDAPPLRTDDVPQCVQKPASR
jgi:hypothetical protein